ncbi:MAG: hypothetical protein ND866_16965 [Pyrinomonadaceae bacterium]|nr:hypothetical protein [Pyrinomonadaceae bacterium]
MTCPLDAPGFKAVMIRYPPNVSTTGKRTLPASVAEEEHATEKIARRGHT